MKEILKHPTVSTVLGTVIGTIIVTPIVAYINKINIIDALILIINWIKNFIALIISFQTSRSNVGIAGVINDQKFNLVPEDFDLYFSGQTSFLRKNQIIFFIKYNYNIEKAAKI
ncbi:hypothetical protein [Bacillus sp. AK128]